MGKMASKEELSKRGCRSRRRGADAEREVAKILNEYGIPAHRGYVQFKQSDLIGIDGIHP